MIAKPPIKLRYHSNIQTEQQHEKSQQLKIYRTIFPKSLIFTEKRLTSWFMNDKSGVICNRCGNELPIKRRESFVTVCPFKFCSDRCETSSYFEVGFAAAFARKCGVMLKLLKLKEQRYSAVSVLYLYAQVISIYFGYLKQGQCELIAFQSAIDPIIQLGRRANPDIQMPVTQLLSLLTQVFSNVQYLFKQLYSDSFTNFQFQMINQLLSLEVCTNFCQVCKHSAIEAKPGFFAIYPNISKIAHSCDPNCEIRYNNGQIELYLVKQVEDNEQLTRSYVDKNLSFEERQKLLRNEFGIECRCGRCMSEQ